MSTTIIRTGCATVVLVKVRFANETTLDGQEFDRLIECWRENVERIWNGAGDACGGGHWWRCSTVRFKMDFLAEVEFPEDYHLVTVKEDLAGGAATHLGGGSVLVPASTATQWDIDDSNEVAAHEIGHILGLDDEYTIDAAGGAVSGHTLDGEPPYCLMANLDKVDLTVKPHVGTIMVQHGAAWNWRCCFWPRPWRLIVEIGRSLWRRAPAPTPPPAPPLPTETPLSDIFAQAPSARLAHLAVVANHIHEHPARNRSLLAAELAHGDSVRRWLAAIALSADSGLEARALLQGALADPDISVRLQAARSLSKLGFSDGVPTLLDALSSHELTRRHPPILARAYANRLLWRHSGAWFGFSPHASATHRAFAIGRWRAWWAQHPDNPK